MVVRPPCCPKRMSVSRRSPTMQIWLRFSPNCAAMLASMNSAGLPTTVGSRFVDPGRSQNKLDNQVSILELAIHMHIVIQKSWKCIFWTPAAQNSVYYSKDNRPALTLAFYHTSGNHCMV